MNLKKYPFMGGRCEYHECALFVKTENTGACAFSVIAEELLSVSDNAGAATDTLADIPGELESIAAAVKGLV